MYDMLHMVLHYQVAVKKFSADVDNDLRAFELSREEWKAVGDLCDVLKVTITFMSACFFLLTTTLRTSQGLERCDALLFACRYSYSGHCNSSYGCHRQGIRNGCGEQHQIFGTNSSESFGC